MVQSDRGINIYMYSASSTRFLILLECASLCAKIIWDARNKKTKQETHSWIQANLSLKKQPTTSI